jgi:poly(hydroxyalkanoate) depolymerase family esterase
MSALKRIQIAFLLAALFQSLCLCGPAKAASLQLVTHNWGSNGVPATVSMYIYVPDKLAADPPILVLIHYCGGSAGGVFGEAYGGGLVSAADKYGFIMVVPQAVNPDGTGRCWDVGSSNSLTRYAGGDSEAIVRMVNYTITNYSANSNRVYVTGTSSGAMMTEALVALYPEVFKGGAEFSGVPAGSWAIDDPSGGWGGPAAGGQVVEPPQEWGNIVRAMSPGYGARRPRLQLWHGTGDTTISYTNQLEAIKQWTDVLGLSTNPTYTTTLTLGTVTNQWTRRTWVDACGNPVLDAWSEYNGPHGTDANFDSQYEIPFLGLDKVTATDPMISCGAVADLQATAVTTNQINLIWNAVAGATSYNVKRATVCGGPYVTVATGLTTTNFSDTGLSGGTLDYYYVVSAIVSGSESANSLQSAATAPWTQQDSGPVNLAGSAFYGGGTFTVTGSGSDVWGTADACQFCYLPVTGNFALIARVSSVQNADPWSKAGLMVRASTNASAANVFIAVTPGNGVTFQSRATAGGSTVNNNATGLIAPYWVKLTRSANLFTGYRSANGVAWTQLGTATVTLPSTAVAGFAVTAHNNSRLCTATFDNASLPGWPLPPNAPGSLTAAPADGQVALSWPTVALAATYNLKWAAQSGGPYTIITNIAGTSFNATGLTNGTAYYFVVSAQNLAGESANSVETRAIPLPALNASAGTNSLTFAWSPNSSGFTLQSSTNLTSGGWTDVTAPAPQMTNNQWQVTLPVSGAAGLTFYRLVQLPP